MATLVHSLDAAVNEQENSKFVIVFIRNPMGNTAHENGRLPARISEWHDFSPVECALRSRKRRVAAAIDSLIFS